MDSHISSCMAQILFLYALTLFFIFKLNFIFFYWFVKILKPVRDRETTMAINRKSGICHRMAPLRTLHVVSLSYIFKITNFEMWMSRECWALVNKLSRITFIKVDICHQCECCTPWPWPKFSRYNLSIGYFEVNAGKKCNQYYCHQIGNQVFAIEWHHCKWCTS